MAIFYNVLLGLLLLGPQIPLSGPLDCTPVRGHFAAYNIYTLPLDLPGRLQMAYGPIVPANEVWLVIQAGIWTEFSGPHHYTLEVLEPLPEQVPYTEATIGFENACCWRVAVATSDASSNQALGLTRPVLLLPGQKMNARTDWQEPGKMFGLTAVTLKYPVACLSTIALGVR